tara:strand:+ start:1272 stop:3182 length:1911 start_codon:yes stop_codon:yes gene_type:complete
MSYKINKTNGDLLIELTDGIIDTSSTDITLVGRNYKGFGEAFNENFVKIIENFASTSAPSNPLAGQLWYDTSEARLKIYDGTSFRTAGSPTVSSSQPSNLVSGDLWIDNAENKLYFWDGTDLVLVGPQYNAVQGKTNVEAITLIDNSNQARTILAMFISGVLAGIYSSVEFTPSLGSSQLILPYESGRIIKVGFNPRVTSTFKYQGIATSAENLIDSSGTSYSTADFVRTNERDSSNVVVDQSMEGALFVKGDAGLTIGYGDTEYAAFKTIDSGTTTAIELKQINYDFAIRVPQGNDYIEALTLDTSTQRFGLYQVTPAYTLDVTGDGNFTGNLIVGGDLTIQGTSTYLNTEKMTVQDPNIELGMLDDSTEGDDTNANGGGITLRSSNGSKDIIWVQSTGSWTFNQTVDLIAGKEYRIDDTQVLSKIKLGDTVATANGLTSIGTLGSLSVTGNVALGSISSPSALNISSTGVITINSQRITGLATPTSPADATTKAYVDAEVATIPVAFSLDITGLISPNPAGTGAGPIADVRSILESISPAATAREGTVAKIHCTSYAGATVTGINVTVTTDSSGVLQKTPIAVDSAGTQNQGAIEDIVAANPASGTVILTPTRYTMTFTITSSTWTHNTTVDYP